MHTMSMSRLASLHKRLQRPGLEASDHASEEQKDVDVPEMNSYYQTLVLRMVTTILLDRHRHRLWPP